MTWLLPLIAGYLLCVAALVAAVHRASKQDEWREAELRRKRTDDLH